MRFSKKEGKKGTWRGGGERNPHFRSVDRVDERKRARKVNSYVAKNQSIAAGLNRS